MWRGTLRARDGDTEGMWWHVVACGGIPLSGTWGGINVAVSLRPFCDVTGEAPCQCLVLLES